MQENKRGRIIIMLFIINAIFLSWAVLWKCGMPYMGDGTGRAINLTPFGGNTRWEMQFNILLFVPFGFLLSAIMPKRWIIKRFLCVALASLILEMAQWVFAVGRSDITDVLLNTFGGSVGIVAHFTLSKLPGGISHKAIMALCILVIIFEIYLSISFVVFGYVRLGHVMIKLF